MKKQKFLAALLALVMVLTLLPVTAFADDGVAPADAQENGLYMTKDATLEDDGTYTINLEAYVTGTVKVESTGTSKPTDVVLVLDMSGSMAEPVDGTSINYANLDTTKGAVPGYYSYENEYGNYNPVRYYNGTWQYTDFYHYNNWQNISSASGETYYVSRLGALKDAVDAFLASVAAQNEGVDSSLQHRVSIVKFAGTESNTTGNTGYSSMGFELYNHSQIVQELVAVTNSNLSSIQATAESLGAAGPTAADYGLSRAEAALEASSSDRNKTVVFFTDGAPNHDSDFETDVANSAVQTAKSLKDDGVTIYSVGMFSDSDASSNNVNNFMNAVSSNYPSATSYSVGDTAVHDYYMVADNSVQLEEMFGEISTSITGSANIALGSDAVLKDVMNAGFSLANASATAAVYDYNFSTKSFSTTASATLTPTLDKESGTVSVTGFDYATHFVPLDQSNDNENGGKKVVVTITGIVPTDAAVTNNYISTNADTSGMYSGETLVEPFLNPDTILTSHAYVVDYAKPFDIVSSDWLMNNVSTYVQTMGNISGVSINELTMAYGKLVDTTYTPLTMNWDGYDSFYAFGTSTNATVTAADANENGNLWSKVSIIPANNVYYEDDFITSVDGSVVDENVVGFEYGSGWTVEYSDSNSNNGESANTSVHGGWQNADLADDTQFSDGSAHKVTQKAKASFTFTGTGVDVYTYTDAQSGGIRATLYKWNETTNSWDMLMIQYMDNLAASGDYYQIPTLSLHSVTGTDLDGNSVDTPLTYGKYKVDLIAYAIDGNATYYLDGIRIYNPAQEAENDTEDTTVSDAYEEDNALKAVFTEVRDILLDNNSFTSGETTANGMVFIDDDGTTEGASTSVIGTYTDYGPKNEVYLGQNQAIAFKVGKTTGAHYFVGIKAPEGSTTAQVTNAVDADTTSQLDINHSTDLFYEIVPNDQGYIIIKNTGSNLLSVTKLQTTGTGTSDVVSAATTDLLAYANEFDTLPVVAYSLRSEPEVEETVPEETVPEETVPEETVPEETEPEVDVEIENPEPTPEEDPKPTIKDLIEKIFGFIRKWF